MGTFPYSLLAKANWRWAGNDRPRWAGGNRHRPVRSVGRGFQAMGRNHPDFRLDHPGRT